MIKYPLGKQDFKSLREEGYVYVDKTAFIPKLLESGSYFFLARPRRFGKSLFLSTLEYFFQGNRELFKGLFIDKIDWNWLQYPVIHLDLNGADYTNHGALEERLTSSLSFHEKKYGIKNQTELGLQERFRALISGVFEKTGLQVVVLVDEYEKPLLDTLEIHELFEKNKETLRGFYGVLKSMDYSLKLVFMTGVTKFGQMNVFSGFNNIRDISMNKEFGAICGITQTELQQNFQPGIKSLAEEKNLDYASALHLLKTHYDGYHFNNNCPDIYNPYSLLNALADKKISSYWSHTGTPSLLVNLLLKKNYDLEELDGIEASERRLMGINNQFDDPVALFYQTGYLTIKDYDETLEEFILGYPNLEVQQAFFEFVLPYYFKERNNDTDSVISQLRKAIIKGEAERFIKFLESFSASISYEMTPAAEVERHFQSMIYIVVKLLSSPNLRIIPEYKTSEGRIDLLIETPKFIYILEIKRDSSPEVALQQIYNKSYSLQFNIDSREIFLIGVNFSTEKKRLEGYNIVKEKREVK